MRMYVQKNITYHKILLISIALLFGCVFGMTALSTQVEAAVKTGKALDNQAKQECNKDKNGKVSSNTCIWAYKKAYTSQNVSCSVSSLPSWAKSTDQSKLFAARVSCESGNKLGKAAKQKDIPKNNNKSDDGKKQIQKDIEKYKKDCKNYNPKTDKKNTTCKKIRQRLIDNGKCNLGNGKANNNQLNRCEQKINNAVRAAESARLKIGTKQDKVNLDPVEKIGVKNPGEGTINNIVNIVFGIAGSLAVLFVVIGGMRYVISRGDPQATAQAKNTILYALIGLIVTIFAFSIVRFVISRLT